MAVYGSDDVAFFLIDGRDVKGVTTQITEDHEAILEETHGLGDTWVEQSPVGLKRFSLTQTGFYDDDTDSVNAALAELQGTDRVVCIGLTGGAIGGELLAFQGAMQSNYKRALSRGALHKADASYQGNGAVEEGYVLHDLSEETADGDTESTPVDNGASSASGGSAFLQVTDLDLDGYDNLDVGVLHSADDITYAEKAGFAVVTAAPDAERIAFSGTVNRYTACDWDFTGTGTSPSATFMVGIHRN